MFEFSDTRNFAVYARGMNASLRIKWHQIAPWIVSSPQGIDGGIIADEGCGTGELLRLIARRFPETPVVGRDISSHFVAESARAAEGIPNAHVIQCNVLDRIFTDTSVVTKIFSTIWHELYSYNGYNDAVLHQALRDAHSELMPGGRIIIRDGLRPRPELIALWLRDDDGRSPTGLADAGKTRSIHELSTRGIFWRFMREFGAPRGISHVHTWLIQLHPTAQDDWRAILPSADAYEFLMKKDYRENWDAEIREVFGVWTETEYRAALEHAGFRVVHCKPYRNPWIIRNRLAPHARMYRRGKNGAWKPAAFPHANVLIVGEK